MAGDAAGDPASDATPRLVVELALLALLATLWGSSYLWIKIALETIPPATLIALRVSLAAAFLLSVCAVLRAALPRAPAVWSKLVVQAILSSVAPWLLLAWGQQWVDSAVASVLNSTSPIFVVLISLTLFGGVAARKALGAVVGLCGVVLIIGVEALGGLGDTVAPQLAVLLSAAIYGAAALYGRRFEGVSALAIATGSMIVATVILIPVALVVDASWRLSPSVPSLAAAGVLGVFGTGVALLLYFRLVKTLGSLGVASQAYLRSGVGVALGVAIAGETITPMVGVGVGVAILGVVLINAPAISWKRRYL